MNWNDFDLFIFYISHYNSCLAQNYKTSLTMQKMAERREREVRLVRGAGEPLQ